MSRIGVFLDDRWLGRAGLGRPRPDAAVAPDCPGAMLSGFELLAVGSEVGAGTGRLRAVVTQLDGGRHELGTVPIAVAVRPPGPATARRAPRPGEQAYPGALVRPGASTTADPNWGSAARAVAAGFDRTECLRRTTDLLVDAALGRAAWDGELRPAASPV